MLIASRNKARQHHLLKVSSLGFEVPVPMDDIEFHHIPKPKENSGGRLWDEKSIPTIKGPCPFRENIERNHPGTGQVGQPDRAGFYPADGPPGTIHDMCRQLGPFQFINEVS